MSNYLFSSESVTEGHPDKVADQISDLFVTEILKADKDSRVAIETAIKGFEDGTGKVMVFGELTTNMPHVKETLLPKVKDLLTSIDVVYTDWEIDWQIGEQSREINSKVEGVELGAGDQGLMFGYATNETNNRLPIPFALATEIIREYENKFASNNGMYKFDSKSQVSYDYDKKRIININLSVQHSEEITLEALQNEMRAMINNVVLRFEEKNNLRIFDEDTEIIVNNAGTFIMGGAVADAGLTGRKIIADTYGGYGRHGGGAFSGKDYTKVDRSAAYYARYAARKIVDAGLADIVEIQVSYIIGNPEPVAVDVETFETEKKSLEEIHQFIKDKFDFRLSNIIEELKLKEVDYTKTSTLGHFGKEELIWQ